MNRAFLSFAISFLLLCTFRLPARAQALAGAHVGDNASKLARLGKPAAIDKYKPFLVQKWTLANSNEVSVTLDASEKIVYVESDWGGHQEATGCDLGDLRFGVTTLADLRKRFGSNGFGFKGRGGVAEIPGGVVLMNSYETGTVVVTFFTKVLDTEPGDQTPIADRAKLDALSIASAEYASTEWGERVYDPKYKKINWK